MTCSKCPKVNNALASRNDLFYVNAQIETNSGVIQKTALVDSGSEITIVPTSLNPKIYKNLGTQNLAGFSSSLGKVQGTLAHVKVSIDQENWEIIDAVIINTDELIIRPQSLPYSWELSGNTFSFQYEPDIHGI